MTFIIGTPHTKNAGYFKNDDRVSGGKLAEADIQTCPHCQAVINMAQWKVDGGWCMQCNAPICNWPACHQECTPFIKKIEQFAELSSKIAAFRKLAGLDPPPPPREIVLPR
jgi:hypothetical protein